MQGMTMKKMLYQYADNYDFLYDNEDRVPEYYDGSYMDLVDDGQIFVAHYEFITGEFVNARKDLMISDRELAAYAMLLYQIAGVWDLRTVLTGKFGHDWESDKIIWRKN